MQTTFLCKILIVGGIDIFPVIFVFAVPVSVFVSVLSILDGVESLSVILFFLANRFQLFFFQFSGEEKTKSWENFQLRPELSFYTKTSYMMMVWTIATVLRDEMLNIVSRTV